MDVGLRNHRSHITHLPDDSLSIIFGKLDKKLDQESFGLTCHHFLDIQNSNTKCLDVGCYPWLSHSSSTDSGLSRMQKCGLKLHCVYNDDLFNVTHKVFSSIASRCPLLTAISLPDCEISNDGLKILTKSCKLLKEVDVSSCKRITDIGITFLIQNCRQLKTLNISNCNKIVGIGFQGCSPTLAILKADNCVLSSLGIFQILSGGGLEYLKFSSIECTEYIRPKAFGLGLSNLKTIDFSKCSFVTDDVVLRIAKGCPLLQEWDLSFCDNIGTSGNWIVQTFKVCSTGKDLLKAHRKDAMIVEKEMCPVVEH
ncbi:RNI-like superfamily protein [Tanacetum coccineum]